MHNCSNEFVSICSNPNMSKQPTYVDLFDPGGEVYSFTFTTMKLKT